MSKSRGVPKAARGRLAERVALGVGLASAAVLVAVAFSSLSDPGVLGRAALQRLTSEVSARVAADWEATSAVGWAQPELTWHADERVVLVPSPAAREVASAGGSLFHRLLDEAEHEELVVGESARALAAVRAARDAAQGPLQRARAQLRELQLLAGQGECATAAAVWRGLAESLAGDEALGGVSCRLVALLAVSPCLGAEELEHARQAEAQLWRAGRLALPAPLDFTGDPVPVRLRALAAALDRTEFLEPEFAERRLRALEQRIGPLPEPGGWLFGESDVHVVRGGQGTLREIYTLKREELEQRTLERFAAGADDYPGFTVDFDGSQDAAGPIVQPRTALHEDASGAEAFGFVLRHSDPRAVIEREGRRVGWLRWALLGLALFAAGTGVVSFSALRRERLVARMRSDFVAGVSHELRTPLASILLMSENLVEGRVVGSAAERYHANIQREAERLRRLVDDVLDFSRLDRGQGLELVRESVDATRWWNEVGEGVSELAARHGAEVELRGDLPAGEIEIDAHAMRRVVLNLVQNAVRHGRDAQSGASAVLLEVGGAGDGWWFAIGDRGPGVPQSRRAEIFEPFAQLGSHAGAGNRSGAAGVGLGLALVAEIVTGHGGRVEVADREPGPGALFRVRMPHTTAQTNEQEQEQE